MIGKKGSYDYARKALYFILVLFVLTFIFLYMHGAIVKYNKMKVDYGEAVTGQIIVEEAITSPRCFAYYDAETGRAYPNVIDADKFKAGIKEGCLPLIETPFRLRLYSSLGDLKKMAPEHTTGRGALGENTETAVRTVLVRSGDGSLQSGFVAAELDDYFLTEGQKEDIDGYQIAAEERLRQPMGGKE